MKVAYLIGAGASAGKRTQHMLSDGQQKSFWTGVGLPTVAEIPERLEHLIQLLEKTNVEALQGNINYVLEKKNLLEDLNLLLNESTRHVTIDTYAKKLVLTQRSSRLSQLENILTTYLIYEQLTNKIDERYDAFLANILDEQRQIPENINIISWNYDSAFDLAYHEYNENALLPTISKNDTRCVNPKIFKINGTATFEHYSTYSLLDDAQIDFEGATQSPYGSEKCISQEGIKKILEIYTENHAHTNFNHGHLSFAFDTEHRLNKEFFTKMQAALSGTEILVVIGYSFPFFNREIDLQILSACKVLKKVYVQDINPTRTKEILETAFLEKHISRKVIPITDVSSFFIPTEYSIPPSEHFIGGVM